jgi:hypothetical protein
LPLGRAGEKGDSPSASRLVGEELRAELSTRPVVRESCRGSDDNREFRNANVKGDGS